VKIHGVENSGTFEHPGSFSASTKELDPSSLKYFAQNVDINIKKLNKEEMVFDLINAEPPLANALRRIMIAEIPTMAIEKVTMWQNTGIIPDENLAHRMGLIPINVDARLFEYHNPSKEHVQNDSLNFRLQKKCYAKTDKNQVLNNTHDEDKLYENANVYSGDLEWIPIGDQKERLGDVRPLHDDILIAKLRPGQEIEMDLICEKGIGKTHAKWSPVCTAYYRFLPDIKFNSPIKGEDAKSLKKLCPMGVFDIEDMEGKFYVFFIVVV
jgi:DNA-directed RNA polymerase I and III subunit RPAC1